MTRALPILIGLLAGCSHRGGLMMPGPTTRLGHEPEAYVDTLDDGDEKGWVDEDSDAQKEAHAGKSRDGQTRGGQSRASKRGGRGGDAVVRQAQKLVGKEPLVVDGERYRFDCSGMVEAAHARVLSDLEGSSKALYEAARDAGVLHRKKIPFPGDVAFFDNTYDRNENGRRDDELTHVAIVEAVDAEGTITLIHLGSQGVVRIAMNLKHPSERNDSDGEVINSYLRSGHARDGGEVLTGELWKAFGSLWAVESKDLADAS